MPHAADDQLSPDGASASTGDMVLLGRIAGAQGLRGEVKINSFTEIPENIGQYGSLSDQNGKTYAVETVRPLKGAAIVARIAGVTDRTAAEALRGTQLFVARDKLPALDEDEWYYEDLIGLAAITADGEPVGEIIAVQNYGAGDLLEIRPANGGRTLMIALTREAVPEIDLDGSRVVVVPPEEIDDDDDGETG